MIALECCMFVETLKELRKADSETSYNLSIKLLADGRCWFPQNRGSATFNLWKAENNDTPTWCFCGAQNWETQVYRFVRLCVGWKVYGFVVLQFPAILKIYLGFKENPAKNRYQGSLFNQSFVICVFSCMHMYLRYAYINKWTSEL